MAQLVSPRGGLLRNTDIEYITELDASMTETGPFYTDVKLVLASAGIA